MISIVMIVVDTNVLVSGLRSSRGASHQLMLGLLRGEIPFAASTALVLEYEDVLKRDGVLGAGNPLTHRQIDRVLDALCARLHETHAWFRFRPFLDDPNDDALIECAFAAGANTIVTGDRHFAHPHLAAFGVTAMPAAQFMDRLQQYWRIQ
jgi:putative PIN family toxin of toxin-antitoxin system